MSGFPMIGHFKNVDVFCSHLRALGIDLPCDKRPMSAAEGSPLAKPLDVGGFVVGNRWCIHPMEGWDCTNDGQPTEHTIRRWQHFGQSGAKLIWGGEAFAVQDDGRANPNQLALVGGDEARAERSLSALLGALREAHRQGAGTTDDLLVGLQLTHSGRFCQPRQKNHPEPRIAYHHPLLDRRMGIEPSDDAAVVSDDYLCRVIDNAIVCARIAQRVGFQFVDLKHCHGYLGHELLSAHTRSGPFGGSLENRTRFARLIIDGIRSACPGLMIGVRLSVFDTPPFSESGRGGNGQELTTGAPEDHVAYMPYYYAFGCDPLNPMKIDLAEPVAFIGMLRAMGVRLINVSCGSPYYNPHIQRPAIYPPSDGYLPPEDPLVGVARQIHTTRRVKQACPEAIIVGSGYTYLQEYLPQVAQAVVREGWTDFVGVGRLALSYWEMPGDVLAGRPFQTKRMCRTFSDCTTGPRNGLMSGCFPLDPYYKRRPEATVLRLAKVRGAGAEGS